MSPLHAMYSLRSYVLDKRWRSKGIKCLVYTDKCICAKESNEQCSAAMTSIVSDLDGAGLCALVFVCSQHCHAIPDV